jgi:hypothetical protein
LGELREFIAESRDEAVRRAAEFFGVAEASLEVLLPPKTFEVAGLEPRVLVLAQVAEQPVVLGPVGAFVAGVLEHLGLEHPMRVAERREGEWTMVSVRGRAASWLRRQPELEEALSHLAERIAERTEPEAKVRVEIDASETTREGGRDARHGRRGRRGGRDRERRGGDRERRDGDRGRRAGGRRGPAIGSEERGDRRPLSAEQEQRLEADARQAAESVRATGEAKVLQSMSSRERWVIHNALKDEQGVRSESVGEGQDRRVKIAPA